MQAHVRTPTLTHSLVCLLGRSWYMLCQSAMLQPFSLCARERAVCVHTGLSGRVHAPKVLRSWGELATAQAQSQAAARHARAHLSAASTPRMPLSASPTVWFISRDSSSSTRADAHVCSSCARAHSVQGEAQCGATGYRACGPAHLLQLLHQCPAEQGRAVAVGLKVDANVKGVGARVQVLDARAGADHLRREPARAWQAHWGAPPVLHGVRHVACALLWHALLRVHRSGRVRMMRARVTCRPSSCVM